MRGVSSIFFPEPKPGKAAATLFAPGGMRERALSSMHPIISSATKATARHRKRQIPMKALRWLGAFAAVGLITAASAAPPATLDKLNDYPTEARADYVFACMKTNGDTQVALRQCSCSIDVIATLLPYDRYVTAQTVLSLAQVPGRFGAMFRSPEPAKQAVNDLRQAQAEAEVRCF